MCCSLLPLKELTMACENPNKRLKLDVHLNDCTKALPGPSRNVYQSNRSTKAEIFNMIAEGLDKLRAQFVAKGGNAWAEIGMNITVMNRIAGILFIIHTKLKLLARGHAVREDRNATSESKVTYKEASISIPEIILTKEWNDLVEERGFTYKQDDNWIDIADPLIAVMVAFSLRYKELRIGQSKLIRGRHIVTKQEIEEPVRRFYVDGELHAGLLEGVTYVPWARKSIAQIIGIGPITALILLFKTNNNLQSRIWESQVRKTFAHFPIINEVIRAIKRKSTLSCRLINLMANLALITRLEASDRAFIPAAAVLKFFKQEEAIETEGSDAIPSILETFDFSDRGLFRFYREFQKHQWELSGDFTEEEASQIVYHSMFGTFTEDFGVLSQTTNCSKWKKRSEYGSHFRSQQTSSGVVKFQPIKQIFYSKLIQTKFDFGVRSPGWNLQYQCTSAPVFSGRTIRPVDPRLFYGMNESLAVTSDAEVFHILSETLERVRKQVNKDRDIVKKA